MLRSPSAKAITPRLRRAEKKLVLWSSSRRGKATVTAAAVANDAEPTLTQVPSLPIFGSIIPAYSGTPPLDLNDMVNYWRKVHKEFGPHYSIGVPGVGQGSHGTIHVIRDPQEMLKVMKVEGKYPSGFIERQWVIRAVLKEQGYDMAGFFGRGEEWRRIRHFMQKDLLHPESAKSYLPGILNGAKRASKKLLEFQENSTYIRFLNFAAMDMFSEVLFGGSEGMSEEDYNTFCVATVESLSDSFNIMRDPYENVAHWIGYKTPRVRTFHSNFATATGIAERRLRAFMQQAEEGDLTEEERNSYFYNMIQHLKEEGNEVSEKEAVEMASIVMMTAVDTTAAKTSWNLLQLSLNQDVQEALYQELDAAVQKEGELNEAVLSRTAVPLLPAFIREVHRCTPALFGDIMKEISVETEIHGAPMPAGSIFSFDSLTNMMDPNLVEEPLEFRPQRWLKEAVEARKGTPAALIDHPFYSGPFSQGARRCPGSRVANLEVQAILAQLLLDYKIEGASNVHWKDIKSTLNTLVEPKFPEETRFVPRN